MRRARQPGSPRTLIKRAVLCFLLGAVLQYAVAAAFGLGESAGPLIQAWTLPGTDHDTHSVMLYVYANRSLGKEVFRINYWPTSQSDDFPPDNDKVDWNIRDWSVNINLAGFYGPDFASDPQPRPPSWSRLSAIRTASAFHYYPPDKSTECLEVGCGWPRRSASYFAIPLGAARGYLLREGIAIRNIAPQWEKTPSVIPLKIYWPGAMMNTFLYAAVLLVPFTLVPMTRRYLRHRAGRCTACNYDLRGADHHICPECGTAAPSANEQLKL